jgi:membrane fusion protein, multidrug efflux system
VLTTNRDLKARISRRAPAADYATRTVHFELDVPDPDRSMPVNTTAEIRIEVGKPSPALMIPLAAAAVRGNKASLFIVEKNMARARIVPVQGELGGALFLEPQLPAGTRIVTEGRALLSDGDRVTATLDSALAHASLAHSEGAQL